MTPVVVECLPLEAQSLVLLVGQNEDPRSAVGSADFGRLNNLPLRIEPEVGQASKQPSNSIPGNKAPDVFHEDDLGSHFANDTQELVDEITVVVSSSLLTCDRVRLAGDAAKNEIHQATKRSAVEPCNVEEDRRWNQGLRLHPVQEDGLGVGFPLKQGHHSSPEDSLDGEVKSTDSRAD